VWLPTGRPERWSRAIRRILASGLVAIGVLFALFAGVFRYVDQHFYDSDTFLADNAELVENADIRQFLFDNFRSEIISLAEGEVEEDLSSELDELLSAGDDTEADGPDPVTQAKIDRDIAIEEILLAVFDSAAYDELFQRELSRTQLEIVRAAELESGDLLRDSGDIFFNMRELYTTINPLLGQNPATAEITTLVVPDDHGIIKIGDRSTTIDAVWTVMKKAPDWRGLFTAGAVLSLIGALLVAERRPSMAIQFGGGLVGVAVVTIVIIFLIRFMVPLLTSGGSSSKAAVATYAANLAPLIGIMTRLAIFGVVLAALGGIARMIWPDDWVYSSVSDERGVRSIMRRRGAPEAETPQPQQQQAPVAAAVPVGYPGYPQPYPGYPQQWGQPYSGQLPPGYPAPYPAGPYAQPAQAQPPSQHYASPGKPTVPVMPVSIEAGELVPPAAPPLDNKPRNLPDDAAQAVPRVVATADTTLDASASNAANKAKETMVETGDSNESPTSRDSNSADTGVADTSGPSSAVDPGQVDDEWASEKDW